MVDSATISRQRTIHRQRLLALLVLLGAALILLGLFAYPWADISGTPVVDVPLVGMGDDEATLGSVQVALQDFIHQPRVSLGLFLAVGPERKTMIQDAVDGLTLRYTARDAAEVFIGQRDVLEVTGIQGVIDLLAEVDIPIPGANFTVDGADLRQGLDEQAPPRAGVSGWDYTLFLIPVAAALAVPVGLAQLIRPSRRGWILGLILGLLALLPLLHFFNNVDTLVPTGDGLSLIGRIIHIPPVTQLVTTGFWLTLAGVGLLLLPALLALLAAPARRASHGLVNRYHHRDRASGAA